MITTDQFSKPCGCRSVGECNHNLMAPKEALDALVDAFAAEMKAKLWRKAMDDGYYGWDNRENEAVIMASFKMHVEKGFYMNNMVDVANLAAFIWNFQK